MLKRTFLVLSMAALSVSQTVSASDFSPTSSQDALMGPQATLGGGYSAHEGQSGYYLDLSWQVNDYAEISFGVDSHLNSKTYNVKTSGIDPNFDNETYGDGDFRPRHNSYSFTTTLRYPFALSDTSIVAPFVNLGINKVSTKDVEFTPLSQTGGGSTEGGSGTNTPDEVYSFEDLDAFVFGAGIQMGFSNAHKWTLGVIGYSSDKDWGDLSIEDQQLGGVVRYEYRPLGGLGYVVRLDSVDQFGDPALKIGLNLSF